MELDGVDAMALEVMGPEFEPARIRQPGPVAHPDPADGACGIRNVGPRRADGIAQDMVAVPEVEVAHRG